MPLYQYEGWDMASRPVKGKQSAASEQALYEVLKAEGIFLTRCMRLDGIGGTQRMLKPIELSEFCRQTAVMMGSGITLSRALGILRTGTEGKRSRFIYGYLQKRMKQGCPMSSAMEEMGIFPEMMINMVQAGESSGKMEQTMTELANHYQKEHQIRTRIQTAVQYPKILCLAAVASVLTIFLVVIPTVEPLFEGMELPLVYCHCPSVSACSNLADNAFQRKIPLSVGRSKTFSSRRRKAVKNHLYSKVLQKSKQSVCQRTSNASVP